MTHLLLSATTLILLFTQFIHQVSANCDTSSAFNACYNSGGLCTQDNNGNYKNCTLPVSRGSSSDDRLYYYRWSSYYNYYCDQWGCNSDRLWIGRLCHSKCQRCNAGAQTNCLTCAAGKFMWNQRWNFCQDQCPYGSYGSTGWVGEIQKTPPLCERCSSQCVVCKNNNDECYICKDANALIDLATECTQRYLGNNTCTACSHSCQRNNYCMAGGCPTYFYFLLKRNYYLNDIGDHSQESGYGTTPYSYASQAQISNMMSPQHPRYSNYTQKSFSSNRTGTVYYRLYTNLCMLCDTKCVRCHGPLNINCTQCRNFQYKWVTQSVCENICPVGQYIDIDQTTLVSQTQCKTCMSRCVMCKDTSDNCSVCVGANYQYGLANAGFLYRYNSSFGTCLQTCPVSTTTAVGYYGSIKTMLCLACPHPCKNCNINLLRTYYASIGMTCSDSYCSNGIVCTQCLAGFSLVGPKCVESNNCREYAYYEESSVSTSFNLNNCKCLEGYSGTTVGKCDIKCYVKCRTCTGTASNQCLTCQNGYTLSGTSCVNSNTGSQLWEYGGTSDGTNDFLPSFSNNNCGGFFTKWGYRDSTVGKYYHHTMTLSSSNHYAIQIKMRVLFIDDFNPNGGIYISVGSQTSAPVWSWNYDNKQAFGQQLCGDNRMDYVLHIYAVIKKTWSTNSVDIYIKTNEDLLLTNAQINLQWGIGLALFTGLPCHSSCGTCTGPTENDCLTCTLSASQTPVNGTCVCKSGANETGVGYYKWANGVCTEFCDTTNPVFYADSINRKCVKPLTQNCRAPYRFGYQPPGQLYGYCVMNCPISGTTPFFASMKTMTCVSNCLANGEYKFSGGATRTCQSICPNGYIADPSTGNCVTICPSTWYLKLQTKNTNPICIQNCTSGYAYAPLQACLLSCPSGFFKQIVSTLPKCVSVCQNGEFGDPDTGACISSCPFPKYGDSNNWLCVETCSDSAQFMQVKISNLYRSCVDTCEVGQYGNPFTHKCSNYTTECPNGYFADSHTHMCEPICSIAGEVGENSTKKCQTACSTGFAHWQSRVCVAVCPSTPSMFGLASTPLNKSCVTSCNFAANKLYADPQANRTCVSACSATPVATFGQNSTSKCVQKCTTLNEFGDPFHSKRPCVTECTAGKFSLIDQKICVTTCPDGFFSDATTIAGKGQCVTACTAPYFADPVGNQCRAFCRWGYYALPDGIRPCVITCPYNWFGINMTQTNRKCVKQCDAGYWGDLETSMCYNIKASCSGNRYADAAKRLCVIAENCTQGTFADPFTKGCEINCSNEYYADDNINTCVKMCPNSPDYYGLWGTCRSSCASAVRFADWQMNRTCQKSCSITPLVLYGDLSNYRCVQAKNCPTDFYGSNITHSCVNPCSGLLPFGNKLTKVCVLDCPDGFYGNPLTHLCVDTCDFLNNPPQYADNYTGNCQTLCTLGTFGANATINDTVPSCEHNCPPGSFARDSDRICVDNCGANLYGDPIKRVCHSDPKLCPLGYFGDSATHMCVLPSDCETDLDGHFYAQNSTKTCVKKCDAPNYGDSLLWLCVSVCDTAHFGQNTTRLCLSSCTGYSSFAQNQSRLCVDRCLNTPFQHFADSQNWKCVQPLQCPTSSFITFADNTTQSCIQYCSKARGQWADYTTKRCVKACPNGYYKDDSSTYNLCSSSCPGIFRYRDTSSGSCVDICPISAATFGDENGDKCVKTCPDGYYAQQDTDRRCVLVCKAGTWGNKIYKLCISNPILQCPPNTWGDNFTHLCSQRCSQSEGYYGQNKTKLCVTSCPSPTFAFDGSRVCIDICPSSLLNSGYFGDSQTSPTRKCFLTCQTPGYYRDPQNFRTCGTSCKYNSTYKSYKDPTTMSCEKICSTYPEIRYANNLLQSCELDCAGTLKKNDNTQSCVQTCSKFYDPTTDKCVDNCPRYSSLGVLYANLITNNCVIATACPTNTWADFDNNICTSSCPEGTYKYGRQCVYYCPQGYYKDKISKKCVVPLNCPSQQFADNQTRECVTSCTASFGDKTLKICLFTCYGNTYGDPFTRTCQTICSHGLLINTANNSCVASCQVGKYFNPSNSSCSSTCNSPYFGDPNNKACVEKCSANPMTFSTIVGTNRVCVAACQPNQMHDMANQKCVTTCPSNTYAYDSNMSCVLFCPGPSFYRQGNKCVKNCSFVNKYADDSTRSCVSTCPIGSFKDPLTFKCVIQCPTSPIQYYVSETEGKCTKKCPETTYASSQNFKCVQQCPLSPRMFAQEINNVCVRTCPLSTNTFADILSGKCVSSCPPQYFADSLDRTCKKNCSVLFSDSKTNPPACVNNCSAGLFADQITHVCVGVCSPNYFAHSPTKKCVKFCPFSYFADITNKKCVVSSLCPISAPYADNLTHLCTKKCSNNQWGYLPTGSVSGGKCVQYCSGNFYSNPLSGKCELKCPSGFYSHASNNTCRQDCPDEFFKDYINSKCVSLCPSADNLFGDMFSKQCVLRCDPATSTYADTSSRKCETICTGLQYADQKTQTCVLKASCSDPLQYSDPHLKKCVNTCFNNTFGYNGHCLDECPTVTNDVYADLESSTCVKASQCPQGTFGNSQTKFCVGFCSIETETFADISTKKCVKKCIAPYFADNTTRSCILRCPEVPTLFGENISRVCVHKCPYISFADQISNLCVSKCPPGYFADESTLTCVLKCPQNKFGNNITNYCVNTCPILGKYFGDPVSRLCVLHCPDGTFGDKDYNRECVASCSFNALTFAENNTRECLPNCLTGFKNERTKQCIGVCTAGYYGYLKVCYTTCPSVTPLVFADDSTHLCVSDCPTGTFGDKSTKKCVQTCPISQNTFADRSTGFCQTYCHNISEFSDPTTLSCVEKCPQSPALFARLPQRTCVSACLFGQYADNKTRQCVAKCPDGTYADNTTMKCQLICPTKPLMFAENLTNKCVQKCDKSRNMFADNATRTCVRKCSLQTRTFADPVSQKCVNTCPAGYFSSNQTQTCEINCPPSTFADPLLRICVSKCSVDPVFYGDRNSWKCVSKCPTYSYGNPLNQQCEPNAVGGVSTCPENYYADSSTQLCVKVCPAKKNLFGDPLTKTCILNCPQNYVADNSTMRCVQKCPDYPNYYENTATHRCVFNCPNNTFADSSSRKCVSICTNKTYAQNSTQRCVSKCPHNPLGFADDTNWICIKTCPSGYFSDNSTLKCVEKCPYSDNTFGNTQTHSCVRVCPLGFYSDPQTRRCLSGCSGQYFADKSTHNCVLNCPKYPALYAMKISNLCVEKCDGGFYAFENNMTCLKDCPPDFYRQNSTRKCVKACGFSDNSYADNVTKYCASTCSSNSWADPTTHICVKICPDQPLMYSDNSTQTCVSKCPGVTYGDNQTRSCVPKCPSGSLSFPSKNLCVRYCPKGYFAEQQTSFCLGICPYPLYGDPSTRKCVEQCPLSQLLYADNSSRQCVLNCPSGSYADKETVTCAEKCPSNPSTGKQTFAADYSNSCVEECALPYYGYLPTKKCLNNCPDPYYNSIRDHMCQLCPSVCLTCSSATSCSKCIPDHYLQDGRCVSQCSVKYYANSKLMKCVSSNGCSPNFGVNDTRVCSDSCADGSFKNYKSYRCDACPSTCLTCTAWTNCTICIAESRFANNFCYPYCNSTHLYYDAKNQSCLSSCVRGTYLSALFCLACDSKCLSCQINSTTCTQCANGLYLQNQICVTECSSTSRPNSTRHCVYCGDTCNKALDFSTNITKIDGENTIFVKFTDDVVFGNDLQNIFAVKTKSRRLLFEKVSAEASIDFTVRRTDSKTIKIVLQGLYNEEDLQLQIMEPENVRNKEGSMPIKLRSSFQKYLKKVQTNSYEYEGLYSFFKIMSIVCVISFLFDLQFVRFMQIVFLHSFVSVALTPQLSQLLSAFRYSTLSYMPPLIETSLSSVQLNVPEKNQDLIFLKNAGFVLTPVCALILAVAILKLLSLNQINPFKSLRNWCKTQLNSKLKFSFLQKIFSLFYLNTVFFMMLQTREYNIHEKFSLVTLTLCTILFTCILSIVIYSIYTSFSVFLQQKQIYTNLQKAIDLTSQEQSQINLSKQKQVDFRQRIKNTFSFKIRYHFNSFTIFYLPVIYLRATLVSAAIVFGMENGIVQMSVCLAINILTLLFAIKVKFSTSLEMKKLRNYLTIANEGSLIIIQLFLLFVEILDRNGGSAGQKEGINSVIIIFMVFSVLINFVYLIFRASAYIKKKLMLQIDDETKTILKRNAVGKDQSKFIGIEMKHRQTKIMDQLIKQDQQFGRMLNLQEKQNVGQDEQVVEIRVKQLEEYVRSSELARGRYRRHEIYLE